MIHTCIHFINNVSSSLLACSFLGPILPIASRCMLLSPSSRGEQDQTRERRKSNLIHSLPDKKLSYGSKGSTIYGKVIAQTLVPAFLN